MRQIPSEGLSTPIHRAPLRPPIRCRAKWVTAGVLTIGAGALTLLIAAGHAEDKPNPAPAEGSKAQAGAAGDSFKTDILPLVQKYCIECHGEKKRRGDITLHTFRDTVGVLKAAATWEAVLDMVESSAMPPEKSPQPTVEERQRLVKWLEQALFHFDCETATDPGRVTIRRLNRAEYNNTVRDLLGIDFQPADDFPSDDVGHGFDNIGDVLSLPPLLMEKYIDAAEKIAASAVETAQQAIIPRERRQGTSLNGEDGARREQDDTHSMPLHTYVWSEFVLPRTGEHEFRLEIGLEEGAAKSGKFEFRVDKKPIQTFDVPAKGKKSRERFEVRLKLDKGKHKYAIEFMDVVANDPPEETSDEDKKKLRDKAEAAGASLTFIEVEGPFDDPQILAARKKTKFMLGSPNRGRGQRDGGNREMLEPIVRRAFRRPAERREVERYAELIDMAVRQGETYSRGVELALTGILVSPHFLFRVEDDPATAEAAGHRLSDYELASRLSYFLWSSMPDDELFRMAQEGKLRDDDALRRQVKRMLADPKSEALAENFGSQWLNLRNLDEVTPDPQQFPGVTPELKADMRRETERFFETVMREDRSILDFLDGNFTIINERLAKHYGIDGVTGDEFRKVSLTDGKRAGVLTHASILTLTSNPTRTSPVKRGKWIMENILGTPPPDPPPDVPELAQTQKAAPNASLRQQLEIHRKDPSCAVCHNQMDALGFGFENFDGVGRWRDKDGTFPIDPSGKLPGGRSFASPLELIRILRGKKSDFAGSVTEKMLTYALGRGPIPADRCAVDKIVKTLDSKEYRFSVLIEETVLSEPFWMRRKEGDKP